LAVSVLAASQTKDRIQLTGSSSHIETLDSFDGKSGKFVKTFLINDDLNANLWGATEEAILKNLKGFVGKPTVEFFLPNGVRDHPTGQTIQEAEQIQEDFRVGDIIAVGQDDSTGNFWMISTITNDRTFKNIQNGEIQFTSPSIWPKTQGGDRFANIQEDFIPLHNALVDDPAFGKGQAKVQGWCDGTTQKCLEELKPLTAGNIDAPIEHLRTVPFVDEKTSLNRKTGNSKITLAEEKNDSELEKLKQEVSSLQATIGSLKAQVDQFKEEETTSEKNGKSGQKKGQDETNEKKKDENLSATEEQTKKEIEELKAKNAQNEKEMKKPIVASILKASRLQGASEDQIKLQEKQLSASTLVEVRTLADTFMKPFIDAAGNMTPEIASGSNYPDISKLGTQLIASTTSSQEDDTKLLEAIS